MNLMDGNNLNNDEPGRGDRCESSRERVDKPSDMPARRNKRIRNRRTNAINGIHRRTNKRIHW